MEAADLSMRLARLFTWVWAGHRQPWFADYLAATFGGSFPVLPAFEALCLMEGEHGGDIATGSIQSGVGRCWLADGRGFRELPPGEMPRWWEDWNGCGDRFYRLPMVHFIQDGSGVAFGERLGPELNARKVGRLRDQPGGLEVAEVRLVWRVSPHNPLEEFAVPPECPALGEDGPRGRTMRCS
jgi:hypothetical protein